MAENREPMELVKSCGPTEAEMIQEVLLQNGIESSLQGEIAAQTFPAAGDLDEVRIWVKKKDADQAKELIEAFFEKELDDDSPRAAS